MAGGSMPFGAHSDGVNQQFSIIGVVGTLGTADLKGTSPTLPIGVNPLTGAMYVQDLSGASGTTNITGTVVVSGGTINSATVQVSGGTLNAATAILNSGTINVGTFVNNGGTVNVVSSLTTGSIVVIGFVQSQLGTLNGGTINTGTFAMTSGTLSGGTLGVLQAGTINSATAVLNSGTINVGTFVNNGGTVAVVQNAGTIATGANTIGNVGTLIAGTINSATAVLNSGTITTAQINPKPVTNSILEVGVTGTTGVGTLITAGSVGAGTSIYIAGYEMLVLSGTPEVCLAFGTQVTGNQVISHGLFPAGGGVTRKQIPSAYGTTNSALTYQIVSGAGTVSWKVDYWIGI